MGVDIGGTFTDIVVLGDDGFLAIKKVSSTPDDYGRGIIAGLQELFQDHGLSSTEAESVIHATTVATNSILEGKGAKMALITTGGFRDVLEMRRIRIPELYNLFYCKPAPLVPRRYRFTVEERMGPRGEVRVSLNQQTVSETIAKVKMAGVEALAVCLLHSYANPEHELTVARAAREALSDVYVTCSCEILPEIREYERTSTTVINAYVGPIVKKYLSTLLARLKSIGVTAALRILQSGGGVMTAEAAMEKPAHIIESGPAAGVIAAAWMSKMVGHGDVITLDMGGTTAKTAIVEKGEIAKTSEYEVGAGINISSKLIKGGGYALKLPFIDVSEIGAGGGSIVSLTAGGLLQVGPRSAGALPGPVCYDQGGEEPTFTDAMVVLGYINPRHLVGGRVKLNAEKAARLLEEKVAAPLGKSVLEAAHGIFVLACATMIRAVKAISTYRGRDPRDFSLFAFGGNGPVAAMEIARSLQMKRVIIPPCPGVFSAFGLIFSDIEHEVVQTHFRKSGNIHPVELNELFARLERQVGSAMAREGYNSDKIILRRLADLRYSGQTYELTVNVPNKAIEVADVTDMIEAFQEEHQRTYGHRATTDPVDLVNLRVVGRAPHEGPQTYDPQQAIDAGRGLPQARSRDHMAYFGPEHGRIKTSVLARKDLADRKASGPLIIEEYDSTCVVPPGCEASLDSHGNIVIEVR